MPTSTASCTATSSHRTSCSTPMARLGHRFRPGQGRQRRRPDLHRRHRRHDPLHGPRAVRGPLRRPRRHLRLGLTLYELLACGRRSSRRPARPDSPDDPGGAPPAAAARPDDSPRPGHDRPHGHRQGPRTATRRPRSLATSSNGSSADRPIRSRPISPPEQYWRWCKRNPGLALASSVAWRAHDRDCHRHERVRRPQRPPGRPTQDPRDEANLNLIQAYTSEAEARLHSQRAGQRFDALDAIARAMEMLPRRVSATSRHQKLRNMRSPPWACPTSASDGKSKSPIPKDAVSLSTASFERYAHKRDDGSVVVRRIGDHRELLELPGHSTDCTVMIGGFSPDGRLLAMMPSRNKRRSSCGICDSRRLILTESQRFRKQFGLMGVHPDGRQFASVAIDGSIIFIDLAGGARAKTLGKGARASFDDRV